MQRGRVSWPRAAAFLSPRERQGALYSGLAAVIVGRTWPEEAAYSCAGVAARVRTYDVVCSAAFTLVTIVYGGSPERAGAADSTAPPVLSTSPPAAVRREAGA